MSIATLTLMILGEDFIDDIIKDIFDDKKEENKEEIKNSILTALIPTISFIYVSDNFSTPNFLNVYKDIYKKKSLSVIEKFIFLSLVFNQSLNIFINETKNIIKGMRYNSPLIEILTYVLIVKYSMKNIPREYKNDILEILALLKLKRENYRGTKEKINNYKEQIKKDLSRTLRTHMEVD